MNILGIAWLGLVSDKSEMRHFYTNILGLPLTEEDKSMAYYRISEDVHLEIIASDTPTAKSQEGQSLSVAFLVDDLDAATRELKAAGGKVRSEIREWSFPDETHRWIYFQDPEENILLLMERS